MQEIVAATRAHWPLVAQVDLELSAQSCTAQACATVPARDGTLSVTLEFPIKMMNTLDDWVWLVDTGPIIFHDLIRHERSVERLSLAYIAFNRLDSVDVILEVPTDVGQGVQVWG